jgi:hypothetical protein
MRRFRHVPPVARSVRGLPFAATLAAALTTFATAHAGRPLATDDAAVLDAGHCQLEAWAAHERGARGLWLNPGCGLFGPTEIALGGARIKADGEDRFTLLTWQAKHLLRAHGDTRAGFALALGGERARRVDEGSVFLNGIATVPLGNEDRLLHLNLGALRERAEGNSRRRGLWGLALDSEVAADTRASIEGLGLSGERARWQAGLAHEVVPGRLQIDASVGSALGRWRETRAFTLGLVVVTPVLR